jgi:lysophospholipase L1-like esterase
MKESNNIKYLALGDSYTIGEAVAEEENFPNRLCRLSVAAGIKMDKPRIIAKTGWTTDELETGIREAGQDQPFESAYGLVTLLIGVNDQYRGRPVEDYVPRFGSLVKKAIQFAGNDPHKVVVLSIPDWGVTSFAKGRDRKQIAKEIDLYNAANKTIALVNDIHYIYITDLTREAANDNQLLASDGLHPSGLEYERWSQKLLSYIKIF